MLSLVGALASAPVRAADPPDHAEEAESSPTPELVLRGFGDVNYRWSEDPTAREDFALGQVDLFVTSRLSDDLSVLGEIVFQPRGGDTFTSHVERLLLTYHPSDHLLLSAGRFHTAIGYYNTAFHHGTWFQTAVDRPFLFAFAKDGGILPIHSVGLSANGQLPGKGLGLHYVAEAGNVQPYHTPDGRVETQLGSQGLAVNFGLYARPPAVAGLQVGGSVYYDQLEHADHMGNALPVPGHTAELIAGAYIVYESSRWELLNEGLVIRHTPSGQPSTSSSGFYVQAALKLGRWRPYARYQYFEADPDDPLLAAKGERYGPSLGLRFDFASFAALKAQYDHNQRSGLGDQDVLTVQAAFTF